MSYHKYWWSSVEAARSQANPKETVAFVIATSLPSDNKSGEVILKKFLAVLGGNFGKVILIISGTAPSLADLPEWVILHQTETDERDAKGLLAKMASQLKSQLVMSKLINEFNVRGKHVFLWNAGVLFFPHLVAKARGGISVYFQIGDVSIEPKRKFPGFKGSFISTILGMLQALNQRICNRLAVENLSLLEQAKTVAKYSYKVIEISLFVDSSLFRRNSKIKEREIDILFLGRLAPGKGISQIFDALGAFLERGYKVPRALMIGSGPMRNFVEKKICDGSTVSYLHWVEYDTVAKHLNRAKTLLLPSDTEGLPNVIIEAMACGTVPIATAVGGIPGVVLPGETGYLLKDNSPETIMHSVKEALDDTRLEQLSKNAADYVIANYSYEAAVKRMQANLGLI